MRRVRRASFVIAAIVLAAALAPRTAARAQRSGAETTTRTVDGVVMRGTAHGPRAAPNVRVVLHRVAADRAGPLDSMLTDRRGRYAFRYRVFGSSDAVYFVSASHHGVTYFTAPLRAATVRGDDALLTVFDTTTGPLRLHVVGHHVVIGQPDANGTREAVEVFEVSNDSSVTLVSGGERKPSWSVPLPDGARNPRANLTGEIPPNALTFADGRAQYLAPLSPGARQLSYAYDLPAGALPLSLRIEQPSEVLEVLLEESRSTAIGAGLAEVTPVSTSGRTFRRFLAQGVAANSVVRIDAPFAVGALRARWFAALAGSCAAVMLAALAVALRRRSGARAALLPAPAPTRPSELLLSEIATLDARFERATAVSDEERTRYAADREALKSRLAAALAAERGAT